MYQLDQFEHKKKHNFNKNANFAAIKGKSKRLNFLSLNLPRGYDREKEI